MSKSLTKIYTADIPVWQASPHVLCESLCRQRFLRSKYFQNELAQRLLGLFQSPWTFFWPKTCHKANAHTARLSICTRGPSEACSFFLHGLCFHGDLASGFRSRPMWTQVSYTFWDQKKGSKVKKVLKKGSKIFNKNERITVCVIFP